MTDLTYADNLRVSQAKIHEGDVKFYVVNASGYVIRGGWHEREQADGALAHYRQVARDEAAAERRLDEYPSWGGLPRYGPTEGDK